MKREWNAPQIEVEQFMANEYVAACGDKGKVYKFKCDGATQFGEVINVTGYTVYANGERLGVYDPCGIPHTAYATDDFILGTMKKNVFGIPVDPAVNVIIWRGEKGDNIHCTKNLNIDSWETVKS